MTKENLKKANQITKDIEDHQQFLKNLTSKTKIKYLALQDSNQDTVIMYSYKEVSGRRKEILDELVNLSIEGINRKIEELEKELEGL